MSLEILKNNPALIRDGKLLNELIEKYEQQKSELIRLGELISEQTCFIGRYFPFRNDDEIGLFGPIFLFNRFVYEDCNNIFKHDIFQDTRFFVNIIINEECNNLNEHQFLKLFEIEE